MLSISKTAPTIAKPKEPQGHDREKQRYVDQSSPFLQHLGISDAKAQIIPSMARKWKQINKFIEIFRVPWRKSKFRKIPCAWWILVQAKAI